MSAKARVVVSIIQIIISLFLMAYGLVVIFMSQRDESFGEYENLMDCINKNQNKRDPYQYCSVIQRRVQRARRRKYGV